MISRYVKATETGRQLILADDVNAVMAVLAGATTEAYDDFTATNGTSIDGRTAPTGQAWRGADVDGFYDPATITGNKLSGVATTWYSALTLDNIVGTAGVRLRATDRAAGTAGQDQGFVMLIGPDLPEPGEQLTSGAFIHAIYRPTVLGTLAQQLRLEVCDNGIASAESLYDSGNVNGPGYGVDVVFEVTLRGDTLTATWPGGTVSVTSEKLLLCRGTNVWIEAFNFVPDPRYKIEVDEFWANPPFPAALGNAQPRSGFLDAASVGKVIVVDGAANECAIRWSKSPGCGMYFNLVGDIPSTYLGSNGQTAVTFIGSATWFNGQIVAPGSVFFTALPTSNPGVAGAVWRSGNDLKVSTG